MDKTDFRSLDNLMKKIINKDEFDELDIIQTKILLAKIKFQNLKDERGEIKMKTSEKIDMIIKDLKHIKGKVKKEEKLKEDYRDFITEIWNGLEDDLTMDKTGESGYKNEKECVKAIKRYTLSAIKRKAKQLGLDKKDK